MSPIHLVGGNGRRPPTDLDYKRCPICHQNSFMMDRALEQEMYCTKCEESFAIPYLMAFWRGFTSGRASRQQEVIHAQMERGSSNRMIWAVAYSGEGNTIVIPDNIMALAGDPSIIIEAMRDPEKMETKIKARFATKEERKQMGLPEGDGEDPEK